ncbi:Alpha/Beta hydrolase protein [Mycena alexandri]|uniref:Alpha/Beta hydrolase protein n=1 Tax=Mycena alexandri TaxID=1745969 RepID=A0AAD6T5U3_9AGAR|nr:Alpha/Beta hydrolase protein [Mycena alexandri]
MPSLALQNGVVFFYTDTGAVTTGDYTTVVIIHGHTFHSGTFQRLNPFAESNSLRIISVNRREYPGSSPYSSEDLTIFAEGTDAERLTLLEQQGHDLAMFVDGLIMLQSTSNTGGIALVGWSMGTTFLLPLIASVDTLPIATRERLSAQVHSVILLQSPSLALGLTSPPGLLIPHTDPDIAPESRGPAFAKWVSSYFLHGDLSTHNVNQLTYSNIDSQRVPTIETLRPEELFGMTDFAPGDKYDSIVGLSPFAGPVFKQTTKALFDPTVRKLWNGARFWNVYGNAEPWNIIYTAWFLEEQLRAANCPELVINFKVMDGSNHFLVWEDPERAINELKECFAV